MNEPDVRHALDKLRAYVEREGFKGYDPYDTLNATRVDFRRFGRWGPAVAIQIQKRNPFNVRPWLGIEKAHNPKGMGVLLNAYATLYAHDHAPATRAAADGLFDWLGNHVADGYHGACWGYNFDWANRVWYLEAGVPSIVVTGFVGLGIFRYFEATGEPRALTLARSACDFILEDLPRTTTADGLCFSYTPRMRDCCYNASLLGAALLARVAHVTGEDALREAARRAVAFVVARQHPDGHWDYAEDPATGRVDPQLDFHQGYVLDALDGYLRYAADPSPRVAEALARGAAFYRQAQFLPDGRARWRLPRQWPVDIHNQAQGILTFARMADRDASYEAAARRVAAWTIRRMQDPEGFFYYRRGRLHVHRISYMRWSQAWMLLALATLLHPPHRRHGAPVPLPKPAEAPHV